MSLLSYELLNFAKKLIKEGKIEESLQYIKDLEQEKTLTIQEKLGIQDIKGTIYSLLGEFEKADKNSEDLYQKSQKLKNPFHSLSALGQKGWIFIHYGQYEEYLTTVEQEEKIFISIPRTESIEYSYAKAYLQFSKGYREFLNGNYDIALDYLNKSLIITQEVDPLNIIVNLTLGTIGYTYQGKGELDQALDYHKNLLSSLPNGEYNYQFEMKGHVYRNIGTIYFEKGDLDLALEHYKQAYENYNKCKEGGWWMGWTFHHIITVLLAKKNFTQAKKNLDQFKEYCEKQENSYLNSLYQLSKALILKVSTRMRDRVDAERIFKEIIQKRESIDIMRIALTNLCNWYFKEFSLSYQKEILEEIYPLLDQLQHFAERRNSFSQLANLKLIQAKLAMLQINMVDARKLLSDAQKIASEHGLQLLAKEISKEHDKLLEELKMWESFKKTKTSISERLNLASVDEILERLEGRRAIENVDYPDEEPVLLLIMAEGGILLFSYPFNDEWKQDQDIFGSFLSAFTSFSNEFFSKGLDRAKFGEETILMQTVNSFSVCYLFKGQTYSAKQKLDKFTVDLQNETHLWKKLENCYKTGQVAKLDDIPKMEKLLEYIFVKKI